MVMVLAYTSADARSPAAGADVFCPPLQPEAPLPSKLSPSCFRPQEPLLPGTTFTYGHHYKAGDYHYRELGKERTFSLVSDQQSGCKVEGCWVGVQIYCLSISIGHLLLPKAKGSRQKKTDILRSG